MASIEELLGKKDPVELGVLDHELVSRMIEQTNAGNVRWNDHPDARILYTTEDTGSSVKRMIVELDCNTAWFKSYYKNDYYEFSISLYNDIGEELYKAIELQIAEKVVEYKTKMFVTYQ